MITGLINRIDDLINPIVVKEIRQAFNSRMVISVITFVLLMEMAVYFMFMIVNDDGINGQGMAFFVTIILVLGAACVFGVGFSACNRMVQECQVDAIDLVYATVLSPYKIVSGKFFSALITEVLLFSLCLPFMCVSYYLRGVDLPKILGLTYFLFIFSLPMLMGMLLLGALPLGKFIRGVILLGLIMGGLFLSAGIFEIERRGFSDFLNWSFLFWATVITLTMTVGIYLVTVVLIAPIVTNRAMPLRIYATASWFVYGAIAWIMAMTKSTQKSLNAWAILFFIAFSIFAAIAICERDEQSRRVLRNIPKTRFKRILFMLFSSGSVNELLYVTVMTGLTSLVLYLGQLKFASIDIVPFRFFGVALFIMAYAELSMMLNDYLKKFLPGIKRLGVFCVIVVVAIVIPMVAGAMVESSRNMKFDELGKYFVLSPIIMGMDVYLSIGFFSSTAMILVGTLFLRHEIARQISQYFPNASDEPDKIKSNNDAV